MVGAVLVGLGLIGCSKNPIPANAHVQELGVLKVKVDTAEPMPVSDDVSLYCAFSRPEQLPQKVQLFATVAQSPDKSLRLVVDVVPTPADYKRLQLKQASFPFHSGERCALRVGENEYIKFTPTLDVN
jgi:hypothetical protein